LQSYLTPRKHMADSADCWLNTTSKVSITEEKSTATFHGQGCLGIKNSGCIQQPMWMWPGIYWTKRSIHSN
jgi:hypothetical protein